jgi:hypothetical protein
MRDLAAMSGRAPSTISRNVQALAQKFGWPVPGELAADHCSALRASAALRALCKRNNSTAATAA